MLYALNSEGVKVPASPKGKGFCPVCRGDVIARCGLKIARHWAHRHSSRCDPWAEESEWHTAWKSIVRGERCEVVLRYGGVMHRADIIGNRSTVIELQHSPIPPGEIYARERFYGNMIWVFDAASFFGNMVIKPGDECVDISWYYPRTALLRATKPVYFHLPCGNILKLEYAYPPGIGGPLRGWGRFIGWKPFFHLYLSSVIKSRYKDGEQPEAIKNRRDVDISKLRFHNSLKISSRCGCGSEAEYYNCKIIHNAAKMDNIRRLLGL